MRKDDVQIGKLYAVKVSGRVVPVQLDAEAYTGWTGTNIVTGRKVHIRSARRLRRELDPEKVRAHLGAAIIALDNEALQDE